MRQRFRLSKKSDFDLLFKKGRRARTSYFSVVGRVNHLSYSRFAFIVSKAVDKRSAVRNRIRRRAREWFRSQQPAFQRPLDLAIIFSRGATTAPRKKIYEELERAIEIFC